MTKAGKVALILGVLAVLVVFFVLPTMWAMQSVFIWYAYWRYVDEVSNLTGISRYLITAAGLLMFIPFWFGATMAFSLGSRRRRYAGTAILIGLAVLYNLSLFWVTRETSFAFSGGAPTKWYALTPAGVRFYDRPGVDPNYGISLKPVTPDVVRKLELLKQGEFKPADPSRLTFFNPITGEAQAWYYRYPDGTIEFYDKPGHHPLTGAALEPVTQQIVLDWRKMQRSRPQSGGGGESSVNISGSPGAGSGTRPGVGTVGAPAAVGASGAGGRTGPAVTLPVGPSVESSGTMTAAVPPRRGIHPGEREFFVGTGVGVGRVHLFNIEIVEGNVLKFNLDFNWDTAWQSPVDVYLDNPVDTAFLVDDLGRQHPLVQATGISADRPIRVPPQSSKRFTLTFPFPPDMKSFKYQAVLLMEKVVPVNPTDRQYRLHVRAKEPINVADFR